MRISLKWLREMVAIDRSPQELAEILTVAGFEVEDIEDLRTLAEGVVVGRVRSRDRHPDADKLSVCEVDIGAAEPATIVCGAANVRADIYVPVATIGTYLPAIGLKIKSSKLRGVKSEGMICSLSELGLEKESEGIHIFADEELAIGSDVRPLLGLDDIVLDVTSTANRADALSMVGIAREVAALTGKPLQLPQPEAIAWAPGADLSADVEDAGACPVYTGVAIAGVTIAPSPAWLRQRLQAAGVRPINTVVDVTNYVLLEWGQPLHAFDRDRLQAVAGSSRLNLGVRLARSGETLKTLDGKERPLKPQNLLIVVSDRPVALAGIMGGEETEVGEETQNLVLEAAIFDPATTRRSARAQGLRTEASTRYERGVNLAELDVAAQRAVSLILQLAGGRLGSYAIADSRRDPSQWQRAIALRLARVKQVLGSLKEAPGELTAADVERILTALGCQLERTSSELEAIAWTVTVPPYRYRDLEREIDLIEEVARLYGYDRFQDTLPRSTRPGGLSATQQAKHRWREVLRAVGLTELQHYSLVKPQTEPEEAGLEPRVAPSAAEIVLQNPLFVEYSALRTELISGLVEAFAYNLSRGNGALNGFEIGRRFWQDETGLREADILAGILGGDRDVWGRWTRSGSSAPMSWFEAKGVLESACERLGLSLEYRQDSSDDRLHPRRTASLWLDGKRLGVFGQLHPQLRRERDLPDEVYVFSLELAPLLAALTQEDKRTVRFQPFSTYPAVERDIAFFAPLELPVAQIAAAIAQAGGELLERVELFDEYRGESVPEGQRSLAFSLAYRASDRTLTDEEVEPALQQVRSALSEQFAVTLRS